MAENLDDIDFRIWGCLAITKDGDIVNHETHREFKVFNVRGNPSFYHPDYQKNIRLDYALAMLFLNDCKLIEHFSEYYVKHKDGNPVNCKLDNLELITDKDEVHKIRFGHLSKKRKPRKNFIYNSKGTKTTVGDKTEYVKFVYIANAHTLEIETLTPTQAAEKYGLGKHYIMSRAVENTYLYPHTTQYLVAADYCDAWDLLP